MQVTLNPQQGALYLGLPHTDDQCLIGNSLAVISGAITHNGKTGALVCILGNGDDIPDRRVMVSSGAVSNLNQREVWDAICAAQKELGKQLFPWYSAIAA